MTEVTDGRKWEASARRRLERNVSRLAADLRELADQIEREAALAIGNAWDGTHDFSTYGLVAQRVIGELHGLLFNSGMSGLVDAATDADRARAIKNACGEDRVNGA